MNRSVLSPQFVDISISLEDNTLMIFALNEELDRTFLRRILPSVVLAMQSVNVPPVSILSVYMNCIVLLSNYSTNG